MALSGCGMNGGFFAIGKGCSSELLMLDVALPHRGHLASQHNLVSH